MCVAVDGIPGSPGGCREDELGLHSQEPQERLGTAGTILKKIDDAFNYYLISAF